MKTKNISGNTINEIIIALNQLEQDRFQATLAIVFLAERKLRPSVTVTMNKKNIAIFGITPEAVFDENGVLNKSILPMLMELAPSSFNITLNKNTISAIQLSGKIRESGLKYCSHPAFIIAVANLANAEDEIKAIRNLWEAPLAGFMSNGEIGRSKNGKLEILNCTQVCVAIKEIK